METQYAIVGGGVLGISIAWGLQRLGQQVVLLDEGDDATRASRGNFGLIWVQGKGDGLPAYTHWTRRSAALWPEFAKELEDATGLDLELSQPGGVDFCLSEQEVGILISAARAENSGRFARIFTLSGALFRILAGQLLEPFFHLGR